LKTKIHFIVNPIAGNGINKVTYNFLKQTFNEVLFELTIKTSQHKKHSIVLTKESINQGASIIVACGGDGTINEIASCLINTEIILGIIPTGSGNGLASNLSISKNVLKALSTIKKGKHIEIDVGEINKEYFFSNMGVGFDAFVISDFEKNSNRKLWSYLKSIIRVIRKYDYSNNYEITFNSQSETINPFLFFVSNSNEMGYKMSLTPKASLQDGVLDVIIVPKLSFFKMTLFTLLLLIKKHYWLKEVRMFTSESITIQQNFQGSFQLQKDGEYLELDKNLLTIRLLKKSLKVFVD